MTNKDTIDIVAEATDLRRRLKETKVIADYYRERMHDAERQVATMELNEKLKLLEPLLTPKAKCISTADRRPEAGREVLTAHNFGKWCVAVLKYVHDYDEPCGFGWRYKNGGYSVAPLYWMPLPPLPGEGK